MKLWKSWSLCCEMSFRENHDKGKQFVKGKSYYANEDNNEMSSEDEEYSDQDLLVLMARKQKKKATQKEISQKTCATENEENKIGIECGSCDSLSYASNGKDSESNVMDLEESLKIKDEDQQRSFKERDDIYNEMISQLKGQIEILNGQVDKYQRKLWKQSK